MHSELQRGRMDPGFKALPTYDVSFVPGQHIPGEELGENHECHVSFGLAHDK